MAPPPPPDSPQGLPVYVAVAAAAASGSHRSGPLRLRTPPEAKPQQQPPDPEANAEARVLNFPSYRSPVLFSTLYILFVQSSYEETLISDSDEDWDWDSDEYSEMEDSEHTLSTTVKTNIQMEEDGLGLILIQNGPYLQISGLVEKSAAERDGKLQSGDTLLKIGHANVLGWTLRELRQLLHTTPIGTVLQIQVYRDFMKLPSRWENALNNIPERKGPEIEE
ncbi:hypothetical protein JD844_019828 [Phrynosoma platyrhinos]|uniref:PDZ domain-containing protein n=1 Tax=Phrynosoma platyrhinos TaxID=52577 RepID=A0ABQ7TR99_PHRPL|nr:hypothetical protein JD844_019828 [Phrynosoma platyrhinos]